VNFAWVQIVHVDFFVFVEKPMLNNTFPLGFKGGDIRRIVRLEPAVQSAPHWIAKPEPAYLEPNRNRMQKTIGGLSVMAFFTVNSMLKNRDKPICRLIANQCRNDRRGSIYTGHNGASELNYIKRGYSLFRANVLSKSHKDKAFHVSGKIKDI